jgi:hypothetical protein
MKPLAIILSAALGLISATRAQSTPPATIPFQARLTLQSTGVDVNAFLEMSFRIYTVPVGGIAQWSSLSENRAIRVSL